MIAIDFETYLISNEHPIPPPVCLSYFDGTTKGIVAGRSAMLKMLNYVLEQDIIIAHNAKFELLVIFKHFPELRKKVWEVLDAGKFYCTLIYEKLQDNIRKKRLYRYGLSDLVNHYFKQDISEGKTDPDAWRLRYAELDGIPTEKWPQEAIDYAIMDSVWAFNLYREQSTQVSVNYQESVRAEFALNLMASTGMLVDQSRVATLESELKARLYPALGVLLKHGYYTFKKNKKQGTVKFSKAMKKFQNHIVETVPEVKYTPKGGVATDEEALKSYMSQSPDDKIIKAFHTIKADEKVLTAFVERLKQADPYIRTDYNAVVSSGRTSSRTSAHYPSVNIQQMPREVKDTTWDVRNCFTPRPGFLICSIDYNGLELTSTAHQLYRYYGWSRMRDAINGGEEPADMHSKFACKLKKVPYEEFVANKKKAGYKEFRQLAKPINLGFPGGIGYDTMRGLLLKEGLNPDFKIIYESDCEEEINDLVRIYRGRYPNIRAARVDKFKWALVTDELVKLKNELFDLYPDLRGFLHKAHEKFQTGDKMNVKNDYGEWKEEPMHAFEVAGQMRDNCTYTALCNGYLMQTPSAVGAKRVMYNLIKKYYDHPNVNLLAFIHDEIVFEVLDFPGKYAIIEDISREMILGMQTVLSSVRVAVEAELMPYWMKAGGTWDKVFWIDPGSEELKSK